MFYFMDEFMMFLKEMIEEFVNVYEFEFILSVFGCCYDGLVVYVFGGVSVVVDTAREFICVFIDGDWILISLD